MNGWEAGGREGGRAGGRGHARVRGCEGARVRGCEGARVRRRAQRCTHVLRLEVSMDDAQGLVEVFEPEDDLREVDACELLL